MYIEFIFCSLILLQSTAEGSDSIEFPTTSSILPNSNLARIQDNLNNNEVGPGVKAILAILGCLLGLVFVVLLAKWMKRKNVLQRP